MQKRSKYLSAFLVTLFSSSLAFASGMVLKLGHIAEKTNPYAMGADHFAELVKKKSNGEIEIKVFPSSQLGAQKELIEGLIYGTVDMTLTGTAELGTFQPQMAIFDMPFLFKDRAHAYKALDTVGMELGKPLEAKGIKLLGYMENGIRHLTNNVRPVKSPADMKGLKIRVMQNNIFIDAFREWKANPVPMPKQELYTALEMKAVDGQENPYIDIETNKMFEVQKYLTTSRHAYTPWLILYSKPLWDKLSADEQAALREAAIAARKVQREANKTLDDKALVSLKRQGMVVSDLDKQEREKMMEKVKPVYEKNLATYNKEVSDLVFGELKKIRGN